LCFPDTSVPVQPHTSTGQQFVPAKEQWADEQTETQICKQEENLTKEQPKMFAKEILSDKLEEPVVCDRSGSCFSSSSMFPVFTETEKIEKPLSNSLYILSTTFLPNRPTTSPIAS
ncbi:hypothetical protein GOODEAATRI_034561, partial [Goodea atripinnis]